MRNPRELWVPIELPVQPTLQSLETTFIGDVRSSSSVPRLYNYDIAQSVIE